MATNSRIKGITIEIGGDTTKLTKALSSVNTALSETQRNIKDLDRALKLDPGNTELIKDKQRELAVEIEATEQKLQQEKEALRQLEQTEGFDKNSQQARNLKTQIDLDTVALENLKKEARETSSVFGLKMQAMADKVSAVGDKIKEAGDNLKQFGQNMTTKVTVPIATGFAAVIKTTADFEAEMSKVQAISGANAEEMDILKEKAREMGETTKFSATEAGQAFEYMAMAGWTTDEMLNGIEGIMNLAAASGEELGTTSDIVTDALTAFNMTADESGRLADILAAAAANANTNVGMMGESFKYVAPVAGSLNYAAEDMAVALGLMANSGIKADMAGTSLRNMLNRMAKPTKESEAALNRLGLSLADDEGNMYSFREIMDQLRASFSDINISAAEYDKQIEALDQALENGDITQTKYQASVDELNKQLFGAEGAEKARAAAMLGGTRAMSGLLAIANASEADYQKLTAAVDGSSDAMAKLADGSVVPLNDALESGQEVMEEYNGAAEAMAGTMLDNVSGDFTVLLSQLQELAISLGEIMMPLLREIVGILQDVVDWLNSLDDDTKETILKVAAVIAVLGPLITVIGTVVSAIGTVVSVVGTVMSAIGAAGPVIAAIGGVLMGPVGIIMLIIAAVAALAAAIYLNWDKIKEWTAELGRKIAAFGEDVKKGWENLKADASQKWNDIKNTVNSKVSDAVTSAKNKWNEAKEATGRLWGAMKTEVEKNGGGIKGFLKTSAEGWRQFIVNAWEKADEKTGGALSNMFNIVKEKVSGIRETIEEKIGAAIDFIKDLPSQALQWGKDLISNFIDGIKNAPANLASAASGVADTIKDYLHFSEPDKGPLSDFHTYAPDMVKLFAQGIENTLPTLERATADMASALVPGMGAVQNGTGTTATTYNTPVNITVYGAQGQDVNALADVIQARLNRAVVNQKAVFA